MISYQNLEQHVVAEGLLWYSGVGDLERWLIGILAGLEDHAPTVGHHRLLIGAE